MWLTLFLGALLINPGAIQTAPEKAAVELRAVRPMHTYSIVARDPETGQLGVAVQSHWFSVGPIVPWAEAGVGAVATQSLADPAYGPLGLAMMRAGRAAPDALRGLLASDENSDVRQVAMIDAKGRVAAHTGKRCIAMAGHIVDSDAQFSVQANLMEKNTVWPAMADAYRNCHGDLAEKLLAALEAAEREGGDIRGRQSAALVIVRAESTGRPWEDRLFDLRVEDHPDPIGELRRLVRIQRAYNHMNAGDQAIEKQDFETAGREYAAAVELAPDIVELRFWQAVTLAQNGRLEESLPIFKDVFSQQSRWVPVIDRIADVGILTIGSADVAQIKAQAR
ncbi:MAG: DUF1028 domain-containing protein [Planctomycetota bacterium]|nr:MAG: DUF1028 domain-containing protein [Planctomycetota bacterium]